MHISSTHRISRTVYLHPRLIDRRNLVGRLEKRHATNKFASVQDSSGNEYKRAVERVEKRVCFTSKHSFARIGTLVLPPPPLSPSSPHSFIPLRPSLSFEPGAHVPARPRVLLATILAYTAKSGQPFISHPTWKAAANQSDLTPRKNIELRRGGGGGVGEGRVTGGRGLGKKSFKIKTVKQTNNQISAYIINEDTPGNGQKY